MKEWKSSPERVIEKLTGRTMRDILKEKHIKQRMTIAQIAEEFDVSRKIIEKALEREEMVRINASKEVWERAKE